MSAQGKYFIGFDPGVSTGYAEFGGEPPILKDIGILRGFEALDTFLDELEDRRNEFTHGLVVVYEKYRAGFSAQGLASKRMIQIHGGKDNKTEQAIGSILRTARKLGATIVSQDASILPAAQLHSGVSLGKNHANSHDKAAYNHVHEYLLRQKLITPRILGDRKIT